MERLTKKDNNYYQFANEVNNDYVVNEFNNNFYLKLQQLENIEEELGCSIEVLFKAIKDGIYFINIHNELEFLGEALSFNQKITTKKFIFDNSWYKCLNDDKKEKSDEIYLEDYKKTWWLKEDRSE